MKLLRYWIIGICFQTHAMNLEKDFPCLFVERQEPCSREPSVHDFSQKFKENVQTRSFATVLKMLQEDPDACPVNDIIETKYPYQSYCLWTLVMQSYGLEKYYGDDCLSVEQWRTLLKALIHHKDINVNVNETRVDPSESNYIYSPLSLLLFGSGYGIRCILNCWRARILDALSIFKEEHVRFNPLQTTFRWGGHYSATRQESIFQHIFRMYRAGHGTFYFGESVDLDFLDTVIENVVELGIDTTFLYSLDRPYNDSYIGFSNQITCNDKYWSSINNERLKKVFEQACEKKCAKQRWMHEYLVLKKSCDVQWQFK